MGFQPREPVLHQRPTARLRAAASNRSPLHYNQRIASATTSSTMDGDRIDRISSAVIAEPSLSSKRGTRQGSRAAEEPRTTSTRSIWSTGMVVVPRKLRMRTSSMRNSMDATRRPRNESRLRRTIGTAIQRELLGSSDLSRIDSIMTAKNANTPETTARYHLTTNCLGSRRDGSVNSRRPRGHPSTDQQGILLRQESRAAPQRVLAAKAALRTSFPVYQRRGLLGSSSLADDRTQPPSTSTA